MLKILYVSCISLFPVI